MWGCHCQMAEQSNTAVEDDILSRQGKTQSDLSEGVHLLLNEKFKRRKTILRQQKIINGITALEVLAQMYDIEFLKNYIDWYCEFMTSSQGVGRKDIVDMFKFAHTQDQQGREQLLALLRGK